MPPPQNSWIFVLMQAKKNIASPNTPCCLGSIRKRMGIEKDRVSRLCTLWLGLSSSKNMLGVAYQPNNNCRTISTTSYIGWIIVFLSIKEDVATILICGSLENWATGWLKIPLSVDHDPKNTGFFPISYSSFPSGDISL